MTHAYLNIAIKAARKAGDIIAKAHFRNENIEITNKSLNDYVTNIDKFAEKSIIEIIKKSYPDHSILAEESGLEKNSNSNVTWIIDPLDGTVNFMHGFPHFSVSIAVQVGDKIEVGAVYDPIRNELFTAIKGSGAKLNDIRLRINPKIELNGATIATGIPRTNKQDYKLILQILDKLLTECADIRRTGSAALDLCYVATNRIQAYFEPGIKTWDMAAGDLIIREAGGLICDFDGSPNYVNSGNVLVGSPKIVKEILNFLQK